ncbi:MAG: glucose-1-phosphate adenylyltransferase [Candidatus Marinimicrobia bacterium]|nr:glucose-1-phosphate adenylyltransferase [Candidatus Neomarinimicrobiota bacterium]
MDDVLSVILGGGKGTRLYPLTRYRAKPAVPIAGKFRLIDIPISNSLNSGIRKNYLLTQFNNHSLHRHVNDTYQFGPFSKGFVDILAAQQTNANKDWYQGTADAVRQNSHFISNANTEYTLILSGDHLYRMDYRQLADYHIEKKADVTICVKPVSAKEATGFGILKVNSKGKIIKFIEKPKEAMLPEIMSPGLPEKTPFLASMGIYFYNTEKLLQNLYSIQKEDFGKHIIPEILEDHEVYAYEFNGYWKDIGTIESFFTANLELANVNPPFNFYDEKLPFYTRPRFLPGSKIKNSHIDRALISDGSYINNAEIKHAVIGLRSRIGKNTKISNSIIMGYDYYEKNEEKESIPLGLGENCIIDYAIIDKNVRIGNNVKIINKRKIQDAEEDSYYIKEGIVVIPKHTVIPDDTII